MQRKQKTSFTPGLRTFISKVITPAVLVLGLLILFVLNFNGVLKTTQTEDNHFHGVVAYSKGPLALSFREHSGIDRPVLKYNGREVINFAQWSSSLSIDGNVVDLGNTDHSYSIDEAHNRIYDTVSSADGWQLIQITTLVDDHTATVSYNFSARPMSNVPPTKYILDIVHTHTYWYNPQANGNKFTAYAMTSSAENLQAEVAKNIANSLGKVTLTATGNDVPAGVIQLGRAYSTVTSQGEVPWGKSFVTEYTIENPAPSRMLMLGTETVTFDANDLSGKPGAGPIPVN